MPLRRALAGLLLLVLAACGPGPEDTPRDTSPLASDSELATAAITGSAVYDAALGAPRCGTVGSLCGTGTLVAGRGPLGPELNAPNTLHSSCGDGTVGTYQSDESLEALKVYTLDGSNFAPGKTVTLEASVWAYSSPEVDSLDLYYAANANSPSWTFIATLRPEAGGLQLLSTSYTLPTGSLQAIRGVYRFSGDAVPCSSGVYDDHDDLVFAVGTGGGGDTTPPTSSITAPAAGSTLAGTVSVSASASDNVGVTRVEFYAGGTHIGTDTTAPYSISWNTAEVANGTYSLTSRAHDAAGNVGTSAAVSVSVSNTGGGGCGTTQQLLLNPGFESGNVSWSASQGVIASNPSTARTGSWRALLGGLGFVGSWSVSQQITIPSTACSATLRIWLKVTTAEESTSFGYDTLSVQLQNTSGIWVATLGSYSNLDASSGYVERTFDLTTYKGQTLLLAFEAEEDAFYQSSFFVDDTSLTVIR
ncbi:MAG: hypothetical protein JXB05_05345 [Myxococcaceae bacterium]|nr:hypothetical protein [Myxococcaceae bacterium]